MTAARRTAVMTRGARRRIVLDMSPERAAEVFQQLKAIRSPKERGEVMTPPDDTPQGDDTPSWMCAEECPAPPDPYCYCTLVAGHSGRHEKWVDDASSTADSQPRLAFSWANPLNGVEGSEVTPVSPARLGVVVILTTGTTLFFPDATGWTAQRDCLNVGAPVRDPEQSGNETVGSFAQYAGVAFMDDFSWGDDEVMGAEPQHIHVPEGTPLKAADGGPDQIWPPPTIKAWIEGETIMDLRLLVEEMERWVHQMTGRRSVYPLAAESIDRMALRLALMLDHTMTGPNEAGPNTRVMAEQLARAYWGIVE